MPGSRRSDGSLTSIDDWHGVKPARVAFDRFKVWLDNHVKAMPSKKNPNALGHPNTHYFWVLEPQQRGAIHYHLALRTTAKLKLERSDLWDNRRGKYVPATFYPALSVNRSLGSTGSLTAAERMGFGWNCQVELTRAKEAVTTYMGKYLGKSMSDLLRGLVDEFQDGVQVVKDNIVKRGDFGYCCYLKAVGKCRKCRVLFPKSVRTYGRSNGWVLGDRSWGGSSLLWHLMRWVEEDIPVLLERAKRWLYPDTALSDLPYLKQELRPDGVRLFLKWYNLNVREFDAGSEPLLIECMNSEPKPYKPTLERV